MKECPAGKDICPCQEYAKEGFCDWPYWNVISLEEAKYMTELLQIAEGQGGKQVQED